MAQLAQKRKKSRAAVIAYIVHGILKNWAQFFAQGTPNRTRLRASHFVQHYHGNHTCQQKVLCRGARLPQ